MAVRSPLLPKQSPAREDRQHHTLPVLAAWLVLAVLCVAGCRRARAFLAGGSLRQLPHRVMGNRAARHADGGASVGAADIKAMGTAEVGLWMLKNCNPAMQGAADRAVLLTAAAQEILERQDAQALSMAMSTWALATAQVFDSSVFEAVARRLSGGALEALAELPRAPEALVSTAQAYVQLLSAAAATGQDVTFVGELFSALAVSAGKRKADLSSQQWMVLARSLAATPRSDAKLLPFGLTAPPEVAAAVCGNLKRWPASWAVHEETSPDDSFRISKIKNFLTPEEAKALLEAAEPLWQPSKTYEGAPTFRTSDTASLRGSAATRLPIVSEVMKKATALVGMPPDCCESLQLVRYSSEKQYYKEHYDLMDEEQWQQLLMGGQRVATVLVYLSSLPPSAGGATAFPKLGSEGLRIEPEFGSAVVWPNVDALGNPEMRSQHAALPLDPSYQGEPKIAVNCWIRAFPGSSEL
eukprot:TRINITY_DN31807_c0_g2_i1.p1 TRINITY_DN31807_c0_g2~~TRINITY_DN31807_c0_g2_i1.p1  ORF type:complete len:469 (-),score=117.84 TRINITY_DN31807_c0_g2_i1:323-1729(-)